MRPCRSYVPPTCAVADLPVRQLCGEHFTTDGAALDMAIHGQWMLKLSGKCDVCGAPYTSADWPVALIHPEKR